MRRRPLIGQLGERPLEEDSLWSYVADAVGFLVLLAGVGGVILVAFALLH